MTRWIVLAALLASAGCSKKIGWSEKKATKLTAGPFEVAIPDGWRDVTERKDVTVKDVIGMMPENPGAAKPAPLITLAWNPMQMRLTPPTCAQFGELLARPMQSTASDIQTFTIDRDQACRFTIVKKDDGSVGTYGVRFTRDHVLEVQCVKPGKGDASLDAACTQVLTSLKLVAPPPDAGSGSAG